MNYRMIGIQTNDNLIGISLQNKKVSANLYYFSERSAKVIAKPPGGIEPPTC